MKKRIAGAVICLTMLLTISPSVLAIESHEDPEEAKPVFSGISLFRYYSDALDFVLQKDAAAVENRLEKMPFANVPQSLEEATDEFAVSGMSIANLVVNIDEGLGELRVLREQFRLDEAVRQAAEIYINLSQAKDELNSIEQATEATGVELKVFSSPVESDLRRSYEEVLYRINKIREMLALYEELLKATGVNIAELPKLTEVTTEELLKSTNITLSVAPEVAFVGDNISFEGVLTTGKEFLSGREVDILVNGSRYVTVNTDASGHYQGVLQVPYRYISELDLQALYYPRDKDVGLYLASLSPVIKLKVLFYEAGFEIGVENNAYPGLETMVAGRFDYGQSPPLSQRKVEIYFDDVLISEVTGGETFTQKIEIDPGVDTGKHVITVSAGPSGRYAPVVAGAILNVTRATPILDLNVPKVAMIPGVVRLEGKLYSEVGPLDGALIKMGLGESRVELTSSEVGTFNTEIKMGLGFGLIGSQDLVIQVLPREPWHAPLNTTSSILMVNVINSGGVLAILIFLGIYLPGRLRRRLGVYSGRRVSPEAAPNLPEIAPAYSDIALAFDSTKGAGQDGGEPRTRIFYWYRLVAGLLQGIARVLVKPQQTLREFATEVSGMLGPAGKYFIELTKMVERLLYSQYKPTEDDVGKSQQLSHSIEEGAKGEGV